MSLTKEAKQKLIAEFEKKCIDEDAEKHAQDILASVDNAALTLIKSESNVHKKEALKAYNDFIRTVITGTEVQEQQDIIFNEMKSYLASHPLSIVCDMNGSARSISIDKTFLPSCNLNFMPFNDEPGHIVHAIIPEPENLIYCASRMQQMQDEGNETVLRERNVLQKRRNTQAWRNKNRVFMDRNKKNEQRKRNKHKAWE